METTIALPGTPLIERRAHLYRYYVLGILMLVAVVSWMDRQLFSICMESIKRDLSLTDTQLGLVGGLAFGLFNAAFSLPVARLADRFNRRNLLSGMLAFWSVMATLCGFTGNFATMFFARAGVGIGAAGGTPTAQSIVSDYFAPNVRGMAMGVFYTFVPIGYVMAYTTGGALDQTIGWRWTFLLVGVTGAVLAGLIRLTVTEPRRGQSDPGYRGPVASPALFATVRSLLGMKSLRHITIAGALHGLGAFGAAVWVPAYFMRMHSMTSMQIGSRLALLMGTVAITGGAIGGLLCDRLIARTNNQRWYMWVPAISLLVSVPFLLLTFTRERPEISLLCYAIPMFCNQILLGPLVASMQALAGVERRATVAALYLLLVSLVSMGFGPLIIGMASDQFHARFGEAALRYSIMTLTTVTFSLAAVHLFIASRTISADLQAKSTP